MSNIQGYSSLTPSEIQVADYILSTKAPPESALYYEQDSGDVAR